MKLTQQELELSNNIHILSHPVRATIIKFLKQEVKAYIAQIAEALEFSQRLVAFHLSILATNSFVDSEYGLSRPSEKSPRVVHYYHLTDKVAETLEEFTYTISLSGKH